MTLRLLLITAFCIILFGACNKEELSDLDSQEKLMQNQIMADGIQEKTAMTAKTSICYEEIPDIDVELINPCTTPFSLNDILITMPFSDYSSNDLIEELNRIFYCNNDFSTCMGAPFPEQICTTVFSLYDEEVFAIPFPAYLYFSDAIDPILSNQIKQYFACEITEYGENNYSDYQIANVRFYTTQTISTFTTGHQLFLRAEADYYVY